MPESLRILILEDNPADAELVQFELQEAGLIFTAKVVMTKKDFVHELRGCSPDLILSDYDLPAYNGALALAEAKKRCPDVPFILVTGAVSEDRAIEILTQGAKDYVLKTRLAQRLVPAVQRALAEAEEHKARKLAEAELRESHRTLEERVRIRTAELEAEMAARKKRDDDLRLSEERYRGVVENTTAIILRIDPSGVINFANSRALEFFGYTADELIGRHAVGSIVPASESTGRDLAAMVGEIMADPDRFHSNANENICKDGRRVWLEWTNSNIYSADSRLREILCVGIDATDRKRAEDALKLHAAIMETVAEGIFLVGLDDNIIKWANRKFEQLFGYDPGEMVGMHVDRVNAPTKQTPAEARISIVDVLRQAGEWHGEIENIKKDGTHFWCRIHVSLFNHPEFGTVMVSAHTDITERKKMEDALRVSEERFSKAFKNGPNAITITRLSDGKIIEGNDSVYELLGYNHDEVIGKTTFDLGIWADADERVKLTQGLAAKGFIRNQEFTLLRKDRTRVIVDLGASLINIDNQPCFLTSFIDITKRKLAEETLNRSWKMFAQLIEGSPFGTYIVDSEFRIAMMNASSQDGAFRNVRPIIGRPFDEAMRILWPEPVAAEIIGHFRHTLETGEPYYSPIFINPRHDVEIVEAYEWELHRMNLPDGQYGVICYYFDSTKLREAEKALKESEQKYRSIFENSLDAIFLATPNRQVLNANPAACAIFGMTEEELCRAGRRGIEDPTDPRHAAAVEERARLGRVKYEATHVRSDGSRFPSEVSSVIMEGGRRSLVILRDITERKKAEEALRESEERFRVAQELSPDGFAILRPVRDSEGRIVDFTFVYENAAIARINGTDPAAVVGRRLSEFLPAHSQSPFHEAHAHVADTGETCIMERKYDGGDIPRPTWFRVVVVRTGQDIAILSQDITERKQAEEAMKIQARQTEEANKELESFSYSVSHDLRAPLRAIDGFSRKLEREYKDKIDENFAATINVIRSNTKAMGNLIEDLLSFSKVQNTGMSMAIIDMHQLAAEVWNDILDANKQRALKFKAGKILPGYGDRALIRQVLFNLLSNAVKFTKNRKPAVIEVNGYLESGKIVYSVKDNGAGFDMEYYDKLFGVFQRLHSHKEYDGTGIGLAIVQRIIKRHGGDVWADGGINKGATFYFSLPSLSKN